MPHISFLIRNITQTNHEEFYYINYTWVTRNVTRVTGPTKHAWYFKLIGGDIAGVDSVTQIPVRTFVEP